MVFPPIDIGTILTLVQFAVEEEPKVAEAIKNVFSKPNPTPADWDAERAAWATPYEQLVPDTKLPPSPPTP